MLKKFKENFFSLGEAIKDKKEFLDFLLEKKAFDQKFIEMIIESNELTKITNARINNTNNFKLKDYIFDISKVDIEYNIGYNKKNKKIIVDISGNTIFSCYDNEKELKKKLKEYINNEEYEKAQVINNYIKKCQF